MMSLTFALFTQVSGSGPLGPLVYSVIDVSMQLGLICRMLTLKASNKILQKTTFLFFTFIF